MVLKADRNLTSNGMKLGIVGHYYSEDFNMPNLKGFVSDRDLVLTAVTNNGLALQFATGDVKDREVVLTAVKQNRLAWRFASIDYTQDIEVVKETVQNKGEKSKIL